MNIQDYIKPELLILIPVLNLIGIAVKNSKIQDKLIPLILGICGILLASLYVFATEPTQGARAVAIALFVGITQGILAAGAGVYINQIIKQHKKEE